MQVTLNQNGFYFFNNGKFVNPDLNVHDYHIKGFVLANSLVQIKETERNYVIHLMKVNQVMTDNFQWKQNNPFLYYNHSTQLKLGNVKRLPSALNGNHCRLYQLDVQRLLQLNENWIQQVFETQSVYIPRFYLSKKIELFKIEYQNQSFVEEFEKKIVYSI